MAQHIALAVFGLACANAARAEFVLAVSPPRFEVEAKPGEVLRQVMSVTNGSAQAGTFKVSTADWSYAQDGTVDFSDELAPGSCRPWVAIERRSLNMAPGGQYRFRFEVAPPADTPPRECRFAILIEGQDDHTDAGGVSVPVNARVAMIVYVSVAGAQPDLSVAGSVTRMVNGQTAPVILVRNAGKAHGRLDGFLTGTDSSGARFDFAPSTSPILPGETREIPLLASRPGEPDATVTPRFPLTVKGKLEWGKNQSQEVDLRFNP